MFLCAIYLIIYALAKQSIFIVLSMGALLVMTGVGIFNLKKFVSHIRMIQTATYLGSIAVSLYMALVFENKKYQY
jgi:flagellar biogenesis protein FliO